MKARGRRGTRKSFERGKSTKKARPKPGLFTVLVSDQRCAATARRWPYGRMVPGSSGVQMFFQHHCSGHSGVQMFFQQNGSGVVGLAALALGITESAPIAPTSTARAKTRLAIDTRHLLFVARQENQQEFAGSCPASFLSSSRKGPFPSPA